MKRAILLASISCLSTQAFAEVIPYGFIKASFLRTENTSNDYKPFFADEDRTASKEFDDLPKSQISVKPSRLGFKVRGNSNTSGVIEFDFDGGDNSPGVVNSDKGILRTRILRVDQKLNDYSTVSIGKMFDNFLATIPHTYSVTMINLFQGNTGFITDALQYTYKKGAIDANLQFQTLGTDDYSVSTPIVSGRLKYKISDHTYGVAYKFGEANTEDASGSAESVSSSGAKAFYSTKLNSTDIKAEYYTGTNLGAITVGASIGNLSSSNVGSSSAATGGDDLKENGYLVSIKQNFDKLGIYGGYGVSEVTNEEDAISDGGKTKNSSVRFGTDYKVDEKLTVFAELTQLSTDYWSTAESKATEESGTFMDVGLLYRF